MNGNGHQKHYDVLIIGAGIAGSALAYALATSSSRRKGGQLRVALLERSLAEPDRIVGEFLQPGGVDALRKIGMESCLEGIDAIRAKGYCIVDTGSGRQVHIPYPEGQEGRSFHHGKFIMNLRNAVLDCGLVDVIEATVNELVEEDGKVVGVKATRAGAGHKEQFRADITVVADGCFSNFRNQVMGERACKPFTKSHFIGLVLEDVVLPIPLHGTVCLIKDSGPVLLYQIGARDTRILIDVHHPPPADLKAFISSRIIPQLPASLQKPVQTALDADRLRRMPNSFLPAISQTSKSSSNPLPTKQGVFLLGDAWNMRHPLTGGGMTVAFNDVVILRDLLCGDSSSSHEEKTVSNPPLVKDWNRVREVLDVWFWKRKPLSSTVNILSVALYDLFGANDSNLEVLREGCFQYFELGGECVGAPVRLLAGISQSPTLLARHFFTVAFYAIWVMFKSYGFMMLPLIPWLFIRSVQVFHTACVVFLPLIWSEIRWWSPDDQHTMKAVRRRFRLIITLVLGLLLLALNLDWSAVWQDGFGGIWKRLELLY